MLVITEKQLFRWISAVAVISRVCKAVTQHLYSMSTTKDRQNVKEFMCADNFTQTMSNVYKTHTQTDRLKTIPLFDTEDSNTYMYKLEPTRATQ